MLLVVIIRHSLQLSLFGDVEFDEAADSQWRPFSFKSVLARLE